MLRFRFALLSAVALAGTATLSGCGAGASYTPPPVVPVAGMVTLDKKPADGIVLTFMPLEDTKGQGGSAITSEEGTFECSDVNGESGCPAGKYVVLFQKIRTPDGSPLPEGVMAANVGARNVLPARYTRPDNMEFFVTIPPDGKTDFSFDLKSK